MADDKQIIGAGRFTRLVSVAGWEYVERTNASGIVIIIAVTPEGRLLMVEQLRPPVGARVVELPAGLAGDLADAADEPLAEAARRELVEETGWDAAHMTRVAHGPLSAGLTSEVVTVFRADGLTRVGEGGGDESEDIVVHEVPFGEVPAFLRAREAAGALVDPKVYAALWFAGPGGGGSAA
ncbi:MAG: NUDIX hydrolase [Myxococcales bacterium]|nr:NUDIX hydrolase [Myxococcales bacterium]MCB9731038.1 NUDIX hydrolase [Deltaproteobacteria bacterium]